MASACLVTVTVIMQNTLFYFVGGLCNFATQIPHICNEAKALRIDNVLIVSKLSRYEYEKRKYNQNDKQLEKILRNRGTNFEKLITHYDLHKNFEKKVVSVMRDMGINVEVVNRYVFFTSMRNSYLIMNVPPTIMPCPYELTSRLDYFTLQCNFPYMSDYVPNWNFIDSHIRMNSSKQPIL